LVARYELAVTGGLAVVDSIYAILERLDVDLVHMEIYREAGGAGCHLVVRGEREAVSELDTELRALEQVSLGSRGHRCPACAATSAHLSALTALG
jgi:hypothetical protein